MATLEIKKYPDSVLRKKCNEVEEITPEIKELVFNMGETMLKNQGIGLAAPQVGVSKRIIVIGTQKGPVAFINPKIIKKSKETEIIQEGCLSFPGVFLTVKRPKFVEVKAWDIKGKKIHLTKELFSKSASSSRYSEGVILARVFQHEIDHLEGYLMIDRAGFWQRRKARKELKQLERQYVSRGQSRQGGLAENPRDNQGF